VKIRSGKTDEDPEVRHVTLRGVEYTIREIDTNEYDEIVKEIADPLTGAVRFDRLLKGMVLRCVRPLPAKPWKFPVYRTLEGIVNDMHYTDLVDETKKESEDGDEAEAEKETKVPNS
jgi:hypothetical protein